MKSNAIAYFFAVIWVANWLSPSLQATVVGNKDSLRNLNGVRIEVDIDALLINDGLNANQIRTDVAAELKRAGIRILSESEWRAISGRPLLLIQVPGKKIQENWKFYTYAINLQLLQDVQLVRDLQTEPLSASTWFYQLAGHGYIDDIRIRIIEVIEIFTNAFRTANPQ